MSQQQQQDPNTAQTTTTTTTLKIPKEQKDDLLILLKLPSKDILRDFSNSAFKFLSQAPKNPQVTFQQVASHLTTLSTQQVSRAMKALSNIYWNATRKALNEKMFLKTLRECFSEVTGAADEDEDGDGSASEAFSHIEGINSLRDFLSTLAEPFVTQRETLMQQFDTQKGTDTQYGNHFQDLRWQFETQIASRHQKNTMQPSYVFHMKTSQYEAPIRFQIDNFEDMKRLTQKMENALKDLKTNHARRMKRYIQ